MRAIFVRAAAAATFALVLAPATHAQSQEVPNTAATVKDDAKTAGHAVAHGANAVGHTVADKSRQTGHAIAEGARSVGRSFKDGANKVKAAVTGKSGGPEPKS